MHWKDILADLVCPACRVPLHLGADQLSLKCEKCKRVYPVRDDIPVLLIDQARIED